MALLFMDGFGGADSTFKWDLVSAGLSVQTATPRTPGNYYARMSSVNTIYKTLTASNKIFFGMGVSSDRQWNMSFYGDAGATQHITIIRNSSTGLLEIRRGSTGGTLLATGTQPIYNFQWNYIEASVTISDTVGEVHVRLNGSPTDDVSYTGDTKNAGTATTIDRVSFYSGNGAAETAYLADCYVLNDSGSANNNFLGDVVVRTLSPNGNGTYSQLLGSDADSVNNYQLIDEHPYSSADYVGSATTGQKDSYTVADLPPGVTTVYGVQLSGMMAKSDATVASARYLLRSAGTDYGGTTRALTTTFTGYYDLYSVNPATGLAWTPSEVNGIEAGMEVM